MMTDNSAEIKKKRYGWFLSLIAHHFFFSVVHDTEKMLIMMIPNDGCIIRFIQKYLPANIFAMSSLESSNQLNCLGFHVL